MKHNLRLEDCINDICPWSGKPVSANALTHYKGLVVGFCNPRCRDQFRSAIVCFEAAIFGSAANIADKKSKSDMLERIQF